MNGLPALETSHLVLRVPTTDDVHKMLGFVLSNRTHFAPWEPLRSEHYFTDDYWVEEIDRLIEVAQAEREFAFILLPKVRRHMIIGQCTLSGICRGPFQAAYLGFGLDHRETGKGLMEEALRAILCYSFDDLNLHRIMANYMPHNTRSANLLRKLGFIPEGYAREYLRLAGSWQDHILTAITNTQWADDKDT